MDLIDVSLSISPELAKALLRYFDEDKTSLADFLKSVVQDLADAPEQEDPYNKKAMMVPKWFHKLGDDVDRNLVDILPNSKSSKQSDASKTARIGTVRKALEIPSYRSQVGAYKATDEARIEQWKALSQTEFPASTIRMAMRFDDYGEAAEWAGNAGLKDLEEIMAKAAEKSATRKAKRSSD